ncbi:hypothetical protein L2D14_18420 [Thalassospiraceae bacterium LMO-JJ14]|nr:hypothetical protein L2D14_18420 [Thalassospiraceae bacterium LMO-JJ14]
MMEPQGHPGLSDDAGIARAARHADLSAEAAASNDRQVSALGRIRGVGDLPTYTADAAENYGDQGVHEVADLIHRTAKADPEQGKALLEQTTARISAAKAARLKQTVASLGMDDGTKIAGGRGDATLTGGAADDDNTDWDEGLSPYDRNKRMFPGSEDEDKPNTLEYLKRQVTDTNASVTRDVPPYKAGDVPPPTAKGKANFYVHHLDLDPKLAERIKPDDIETLRLLERFRQLDGDGTKALEKRLGDLRERDPQLFNALNGKRAVALANPGLELWSMSDKELEEATARLQQTKGATSAAKLSGAAGATLKNAIKGRYPDLTSTGADVLKAAGLVPSDIEKALRLYEAELNRRRDWNDQR